MAKLIKERMTVANEQELVVFLIGMRVNNVWKVQKWTPVAAAMTRMLKELNEHPEMGFLGAEMTLNFPTTLMVQYWRSFEEMSASARNILGFIIPWPLCIVLARQGVFFSPSQLEFMAYSGAIDLARGR